MYQILKKQKVGDGIYELQLAVPHIARRARPGNFLIIRANDRAERLPFTIADIEGDTITIVFKVQGKSTADLSKLKRGNSISDAVGPLGNPSELGEFGTVVLAAGGMGLTSTYLISKALKSMGNVIINIVGASTVNRLFWLEKFQEVSDHLVVCTGDGSLGDKCRLTKQLERIVRRTNVHRVIAAGPPLMLKKVARITHQRAVTKVHLSSVMLDGLGMCGGCRVDIDGKTKYICIDGPEFDAESVDFDSLDVRRTRFSTTEKRALQEHHGCIERMKTRVQVRAAVKDNLSDPTQKNLKRTTKSSAVKKQDKGPQIKSKRRTISRSIKSISRKAANDVTRKAANGATRKAASSATRKAASSATRKAASSATRKAASSATGSNVAKTARKSSKVNKGPKKAAKAKASEKKSTRKNAAKNINGPNKNSGIRDQKNSTGGKSAKESASQSPKRRTIKRSIKEDKGSSNTRRSSNIAVKINRNKNKTSKKTVRKTNPKIRKRASKPKSGSKMAEISRRVGAQAKRLVNRKNSNAKRGR